MSSMLVSAIVGSRSSLCTIVPNLFRRCVTSYTEPTLPM